MEPIARDFTGHFGQGEQSMAVWAASLGPCFIFGPYRMDETPLFQSHTWVVGGDVKTLMPPPQLSQPAVLQHQLALPWKQCTQLTLSQERMEPTMVARADSSGHHFRLANAKLPRPSLRKNTKWRIRNAKLQPPVPLHFVVLGRTSTWDLPPLGSKDYAGDAVGDMWEVETQVCSENGSTCESLEEWEEKVPALVNETIDSWEEGEDEVLALANEPCKKMPVNKSRPNTSTFVSWEDWDEKGLARVPMNESRLNGNTADRWEDLEEGSSALVNEPCSEMPVNESRFDGDWGKAVICGATLAFIEDKSEQIKLTVTGAQTFQMAYFDRTTYMGRTYEAKLRHDGRLFWDDGEVWCRKRKQVDGVQVPAAIPPSTTESETKEFVVPATRFVDKPPANQVSPVVQSTEPVTCKSTHGFRVPSPNACCSTAKCRLTALYVDINRQPRKPDVKRYEGIVKYFRGSFGWIQCPEISAKYRGCDIFLHKQDCVKKVGDRQVQPKQNDKITFQLSTDEKGNPKAIAARIHVNDTKDIETIDANEFFHTRKERLPTLLRKSR